MEDSAESPNPSSVLHPPSSPFRTLLWAIYLAVSWTWCIGMFLPVLLVRDYGIWGFVVFAVPNVIGAAAMGWIIPDGRHTLRLMLPHSSAAIAFTLVTITFQFYFIGWWMSGVAGVEVWLYVGAALFVLLFVLFSWFHGHVVAAALTLVCSLVVAAVLLAGGLPALPAPRHRPWPDLLYLATTCLFGFLLCPYLDLTFHKARLETFTASSGRIAFTVGFGVFFAAMILFALSYVGVAVGPRGRSLTLILLHMSVQIAFTVVAHWATVRSLPRDAERRRWGVVAIACAVGGAALGIAARHVVRERDLSAGEIGYRLFMSFYALVFPAYVWLCMIPTWHDPTKPSRRSLGVFAAAVVVAAPFYWLGFIEQKMFWLLPGLGVVLLARLAVPRRAVVA